MNRQEILTNKMDWVTVALFMAIVFLGWLNIYAVTYDSENDLSIFNLTINSGRQLLFIAGAFVIVLAILIIDMRFYETFAYVIYAAIMFLLLLVPIVGKEVGGNKAWLGIGSFGVQPSEFAKFATALAVAKFMGSIGFRMDQKKNQIILFVMIGIPMLLVLAQKDTGTALVFTSFTVVYFREGMSPMLIIAGIVAAIIFVLTLLVNEVYLFIGIGVILLSAIMLGKKKPKRIAYLTAGAIALCGIIKSVDYVITDVLRPHQQARVKALINPDADPLGFGWNVTQSKIAIGSGGFMGKGFLQGTQTKFNFVPEQSTDFIFCTIGEEHGWLGSLLTISLFVGLMLRVVYLAERQKNRFARVYGYSVACIFLFHFAVNIGMTVGLFPVIGIPLPFFSYGGSGLWAFTILLFILLKLDVHRMQVLQRI
ncbi:MAG TPA: rod shape-determining protein RodA [Chryseolinea sp.]|nr:rod shape-determining protein RodA [Chryseolinea sp.]